MAISQQEMYLPEGFEAAERPELRLVRPVGLAAGSLAVADLLTVREVEQIDLASHGLTAPEAAEVCGLAYKTVKNYRYNAIYKTDAGSISHLVRLAWEEDLYPEQLHDVPLRFARLSRPQHEELELASRGLNAREAAAQRYVAPITSKHNRERARKRLGARNMPHAVRIALESGII